MSKFINAKFETGFQDAVKIVHVSRYNNVPTAY